MPADGGNATNPGAPPNGTWRVGVSEVLTGRHGRDVRYLRRLVPRLEALGFDGLWMGDRPLLVPHPTSRHPIVENHGSFAADPDVGGPLAGTFSAIPTLSAAAALSTTLHLGTAVALIPFRNPLLFARDIATLDQLSEGRLRLGVGVGWMREEYTALGVPWEDRGQRADEYLAVLRQVWSGEPSDFSGDFVDFRSVTVLPTPRQRPNPPVLIGGVSDATIRRVVTAGDGWLGNHVSPDEAGRFIERLDGALTRAGRCIDDLILCLGRRPSSLDRRGFDELPDYFEKCAAFGVRDFVCSTWFRVDDAQEKLGDLADALGLEGRS